MPSSPEGGARVPATESDAIVSPPEPSDVPDPSTGKQPDPTSDPEPTDADNDSPTTNSEPDNPKGPEPTADGEEPNSTNREPEIISSDVPASAPEDPIPGSTEAGEGEPLSTPEASDPPPALLPPAPSDDLETGTITADTGSEGQTSNTRAGLVRPTLSGGNGEPTATDVEPTSAASDGADEGDNEGEDNGKGTDDPKPPPGTPSMTDGKGPESDVPSKAGDKGDSPKTGDGAEEPQETQNSDSDSSPTLIGSSDIPPKASAPAATGKDGFTTVTDAKPGQTGEAYEVPVDLEEDTVLGDYAEFKKAADGGQVV